MKLEKYSKESECSYSFGAFPTFELIKNKPKQVVKVLVHSKLKQSEEIKNLFELCKKHNILIECDDKSINRVADKENVFVVGVFKKYACSKPKGNNLVLVNPSDMGNIGTIMRTMLGFGVKNLCVVKPCVDYFNPKVVRASMGAIFSLNIVEFNSVEEYFNTANKKYFFMLDGSEILGKFKIPHNETKEQYNNNIKNAISADSSLEQNKTNKDKHKKQTENFDLVFGNEAHGLPDICKNYGTAVLIKHSKDIDSLNLPISVGVALYEFYK